MTSNPQSSGHQVPLASIVILCHLCTSFTFYLLGKWFPVVIFHSKWIHDNSLGYKENLLISWDESNMLYLIWKATWVIGGIDRSTSKFWSTYAYAGENKPLLVSFQIGCFSLSSFTFSWKHSVIWIMQFRPAVPPQQAHSFMPPASHQFLPVGQGMPGSNAGMPSPLFPQASQHMPPRSGPPGQGIPSSQGIPMPYMQPNRPITNGSLQPQQSAPMGNLPNLNGPGMPLSSSYTVWSYM